MSGVYSEPSATRKIQFTNTPLIAGLTSKTIVVDCWGHSQFRAQFIIWDGVGTDTDEAFLLQISQPLSSGILTHFSTTNGDFGFTAGLTANQWNRVIVTYNGNSTSNKPAVYVNGVSRTVTTNVTPSGTYRTGTAVNMDFFSFSTYKSQFRDYRIYSGIKTASQISAIAAENIETSPNIDESNLVFHVPFTMCSGLTYPTYAGANLQTSNQFVDRVNGYAGVPDTNNDWLGV